MRRSIWTRVLAVLLIISLLAAPVSAAGIHGNGANGWGFGGLIDFIWDIIRDIIDDLINPGEPEPTEPIETTPPTVPEETTAPTEPVETEPEVTEPEETEPEETQPEVTEPEEEVEKVMSVVEHQSNTDNGSLLRATTYNLASVAGSTEPVNTISTFSTRNMAPYALTAASTAAETNDAETAAAGTTVKYFPVTMFNYDGATINAATDLLDSDTTVREGLYFSNGGSELYATYDTKTDLSAFVDGDYYIQNLRAKDNLGADGNVWLYYNENGSNNRKINATTQAKATVWTLTNKGDNKVTLTYVEDGTTYYMTVGDTTSDVTTTYTELTLEYYSYSNEGIQILGSEYLCQFGGKTVTEYGGYEQSNDDGNGMAFYPVTDGVVSTSPVTTGTATSTVLSSGYERWNWWSYNVSGNTEQNKFYTGLVQNTLLDDQIVFNVLEGGIFTDDNQVKDVYEYVGLPFVLENGFYVFDSDTHGVYFEDTDSDGTANPASGTEDNAYNLYFDEGNTQGWSGMEYGDGSTNLWAPYNTNANDTGEGAIDYHFGMRADLPFSMTPNGRVKSTDDESDHIVFDFAGDDDVWIFIDGVLVIDLGGIHNRLGARVDFAENTITYYRPDSNNRTLAIGSYNTPDDYPLNDDGTITKRLFNDADGEGVIKMTRDAFAADIDHEMQVFYLERGKGTSNCKITFNLPMKDEVVITKDATQSWSEQNQDDEDEGVDDLTAAEQAIINNIDFGFTLYKKDAESGIFAPVANTNFYREGDNITSVVTGTTDENGHFTLKNGESARFITEIPADGVTYYVVEDTVPEGFVTPDFNFKGTATGGYDWYEDENDTTATHVTDGSLIPEQEIDLEAAENKSYLVTVYGSIESTDTVEFICSNFLDAELPNPTALAYEDIIVIDYGLPVDIDPLANDVFRGDSVEIIAYGGADLTLAEPVVDKDGDGIFEEDELEITADDTFESGTVTFNDKTYRAEYDTNGKFIGDRDTFTYTLTEQLTEVEVLTYIIKVTGSDTQDATQEKLYQYDYAIGKVYIVPATIMYYEENFSDLVTFTGSNWGGIVTTDGASDRQEPGVVGTIDDSTYGSDVAYLNDSYDSNGTSKYADTTNGAVRFTYTFTGTGTSIFARTSDTTGYVQIKLYEGTDTSSETGVMVNITYRDTYWKDENNTDLDSDGTLYNIPIYTEDGLEYGTYTVVATVAKAGTATEGNLNGSGKDFWLDGIRIMQPLNVDNETVIDEETGETITDLALGAYATDGESNLDVVTLRQKLITDAEDGVAIWDGTNFVVLTDIDGAIITAEDYTSIGPKEEVYLAPGQKVSFSLKYWQPEGLKLYMGMKAPFGSAALKIGQSTYSLANTVDCYYDVTTNYSSLVTREEQGVSADGYLLYEDANGEVYYLADDGEYYDYDTDAAYTGTEELSEHMVSYYVVTYTFEATDSIVSLTNIKVVGNYEFTIVENTDIDVPGDEGGDVVVDGSEG